MTKQEKIRKGIEAIMSQSYQYPMSDSMEWEKDVANDVLSYLHSQGVVIRVDRELPIWFVDAIDQANKLGKLPVGSGKYVNMLKAGYVAVEPLIKRR